MIIPKLSAPARLTAADAEWFDWMAENKREAAKGNDSVFATQCSAEAAGLDAMAAALCDPAARGVPTLRQGRNGETAPPDDPDRPWKMREVAQAVAASQQCLPPTPAWPG